MTELGEQTREKYKLAEIAAVEEPLDPENLDISNQRALDENHDGQLHKKTQAYAVDSEDLSDTVKVPVTRKSMGSFYTIQLIV